MNINNFFFGFNLLAIIKVQSLKINSNKSNNLKVNLGDVLFNLWKLHDYNRHEYVEQSVH